MRDVVDSYNLAQMDAKQRKLVPFIVLLVKACDSWKEKVGNTNQNNGSLPKNYEEQTTFRNLLQKDAAGLEEPENYPEAFSNAAYAFKPANEIPDNVQILLDMCDEEHCKDSFWVYIKALKAFITTLGRTPVSGLIPDFHSDTESYVKIKNLYNDQAQKDYLELLKIAQEISGTETLDQEELKLFCRNWLFAEAIQMRPIQTSVNTEWLYEEDPAGFGWYFVFRAADKFFESKGRHAAPDDQSELSQLVKAQVKEAGLEDYEVDEKFIAEM